MSLGIHDQPWWPHLKKKKEKKLNLYVDMYFFTLDFSYCKIVSTFPTLIFLRSYLFYILYKNPSGICVWTWVHSPTPFTLLWPGWAHHTQWVTWPTAVGWNRNSTFLQMENQEWLTPLNWKLSSHIASNLFFFETGYVPQACLELEISCLNFLRAGVCHQLHSSLSLFCCQHKIYWFKHLYFPRVNPTSSGDSSF
jgi:hypothetical protein